MGRTTIARDLISLIQLGRVDKERILRDLDQASSGAEQLRTGPPAATVTLYRARDAQMTSALARGTEAMAAPIYDVVTSASLYGLSDASRVDVLRFGRHPGQDIQILDHCVSREHGLVIYAGQLPLFCDFGTLKHGAHAGSTNGTYLNGVTQIRDAMISWLPGHELMFGSGLPRRSGYAFKLGYELHELPPTN